MSSTLQPSDYSASRTILTWYLKICSAKDRAHFDVEFLDRQLRNPVAQNHFLVKILWKYYAGLFFRCCDI